MATLNIEFPIGDNWFQDGRYIGNRPARGFCFDTVKRCYRKIGTEKWIDEKEIVISTPPATAERKNVK